MILRFLIGVVIGIVTIQLYLNLTERLLHRRIRNSKKERYIVRLYSNFKLESSGEVYSGIVIEYQKFYNRNWYSIKPTWNIESEFSCGIDYIQRRGGWVRESMLRREVQEIVDNTTAEREVILYIGDSTIFNQQLEEYPDYLKRLIV